MKDRIEALIGKLDVYRDSILGNYLTSLDHYDPENGSMDAVERAGLLHDLDKHITNLHMEMVRLDKLDFLDQQKVVANA